MTRGGKNALCLGVALLIAASIAGLAASIVIHGISARDEPTVIEVSVARALRRLAIPRPMRSMANQVPVSAEALAGGRHHFADHCASCHGNDGRGRTPIGRNLYPKAPDMTLAATQDLSDGELFAIIENGVRLTGMPAWGTPSPDDDEESWQLVHFIRHLPEIDAAELVQMASLNPRTRQEWEEAEGERKFLEGSGDAPAPPSHDHPAQ